MILNDEISVLQHWSLTDGRNLMSQDVTLAKARQDAMPWL